MSLMWIPPQITRPPFLVLRNASTTSVPAGAKMMAASSGCGGAAPESPAQCAPQLSAVLRRGIARPREREHLPSISARDLGEDVRRGAEAVDAERPGVPARGRSGSRSILRTRGSAASASA